MSSRKRRGVAKHVSLDYDESGNMESYLWSGRDRGFLIFSLYGRGGMKKTGLPIVGDIITGH